MTPSASVAAAPMSPPPPPVGGGPFEHWLVRINRGLLVVLMAGMTGLVIANVIGRYVFNHSFVWAEELSRYMMIWVGFLGAGLVLRIGAHLAVDVFQDWMPAGLARWVRAAVVALLAATFVAMFWLGTEYVRFAWGQETPVLNWNFGLVYLAIPIGAALLLVNLAFVARSYVRERGFRHDLGLGADEATL